jgi:hypothetical protein
MLPASVLLTLAFPVVVLLFEAARPVSDVEAARLLDRLLDNQQRLVTSVELLTQARQSAMSQAQLSSTARILSRIDPKSAFPVRIPWSAVWLSTGLLFVAFAIVLLKTGGLSFTGIVPGQLPPDPSLVAAVQSPTPASGLPESGLTPTTEVDGQPTPGSTPGEGQNGTNPGDAASQAAGSQQAQADLNRLGKALDGQSATQGAADSLRQGKYDEAARQLSQLGEQNDQLSPNAKEDLANALEQAANDTQTDSALRDAERRAADALRKGDYRQTEQALKDLGGAIQQTANNVVPQQELAKNFPENPTQQSGQAGLPGQAGQQSQSGQQGDQSQQGNSGTQSGQSGQQGADGSGGQQGQGGQQGDQGQQGSNAGGGNDNGQQGQGTAPGEGHRVTGPVDPSRPAVKTNPFELDGNQNPNNTRPADKTDNPALTLEGSGSSGVASSPGSGNALNTPGESNSPPVERWNLLERYFGHGK